MGDSNPNDSIKLALEVGELVGERCVNEIRSIERSLNERIDRNHRETMQEIEKVKEKQNEIALDVARHGQRLKEGEGNFEELFERVEKVEAFEARIVTLEERDRVTLQERDRARESSTPADPKKKVIIVGAGAVGGGLGVWGLIEGLKKIFS